MWKGRFNDSSSNLLKKYSESISFDWRLYPYDIKGSIAHVNALKKANVVTSEEKDLIEKGLLEILKDIDSGNFNFREDLEDIHMNIEFSLTQKIGAVGAKLHTSRSRNDQVALDTRLYCRDEINKIVNLINTFQKILINISSINIDVVIPGYTHLQRGQPVLLSHHLLAYVEMLQRDKDRLLECYDRVNVMPLGSGALAGSTILLDRDLIAKELNFPKITQNSMDAVSDRDYVAELIFIISLIGIHFSRLSEDIILWASAEFNFVTLSDKHTTGSSLMPQKKNPDISELARGKSGRMIGNLVSILTVIKGLPMTYNRDLQEDKEPLFDSIDQIKMILEVYSEMIEAMEVHKDVTLSASSDEFLLATDLADYLVIRGVPFRNAHNIIGELTAFSIKEGREFSELKIEEFKSFSDHFSSDVFDILKIEKALESRKSIGSPSPINVRKQLLLWEEKLS